MVDRKVIVDTNIFARLNRIDEGCAQFEYLVAAYDGVAVVDPVQFALLDYCDEFSGSVECHEVSDEDVVLFVNTWSGDQNVHRLFRDPADCKFALFASRNPDSVLLTCDKGLLFLVQEMGLERRCFKAAFGDLNEWSGGALFDSRDFDAAQMLQAGSDPFFHYSVNTWCPQCDPREECKHRGDRRR